MINNNVVFGKTDDSDVTIILGLRWGDEGKGKVADYATPYFDIDARFNGIDNAGHSIEFNGQKYVTHSIPSGIFTPSTKNFIADGCGFNSVSNVAEITDFMARGINVRGRLFISKNCPMVTPLWIMGDRTNEYALGSGKVGSTGRGVSDTISSVPLRKKISVGDFLSGDHVKKYKLLKKRIAPYQKATGYPGYDKELRKLESDWFKSREDVLSLESDGVYTFVDTAADYFNKALRNNEKILLEGAQGVHLDPVFGNQPFVTSSHIGPGAFYNCGVGPRFKMRVIGVVKAYDSRVGNGPFPTELGGRRSDKWCQTHTRSEEEILDLKKVSNLGLRESIRWRKKCNEYGSSTGRPRRVGIFDLPLLARSVMMTGTEEIVLTYVDAFDDEDFIPLCVGYTDQKGNFLTMAPHDITQDFKIKVKQFPSWKTKSRNFLASPNTAPQAFKDYISFIEEYLTNEVGWKVKICAVSYGPEREAIATLY